VITDGNNTVESLSNGRRFDATAQLGNTITPFRLPVFMLCSLVSILLNYYFGKETGFDSLSYHVYAGFSAVNDRFGSDYFAAGAQSYFNPYAHLPFYALVKTGLPALAVGTILAAFQSIMLWLAFELAWLIAPGGRRRQKLFFAACATIFSLANPLLLQQLGSSFTDLTTGELVLGGWLLLGRAVQYPRRKRILLAAILLGVATALKPTNAVHAVSSCLLLAYLPLPIRERVKSELLFIALLGASFVMVATPWSYRLAEMFGNPMFPMMNGIFKSPEFTTESLVHHRFIPGSLVDALRRPFDIISSEPMVHDELSAPDIRYACLAIVLSIYLLARLWQRIAGVDVSASIPKPNRTVIALGSGLGLDWVLWLAGSGNSRYFIPMACVTSVVTMALLFDLLKHHVTGRNGILTALFLGQLILLSVSTEYRWKEVPWGGPWFDVKVPKSLSSQPNLYLSIGLQSNSFVLPFLPKGSAFINIMGASALGPEGAGAARVSALINRSTPHVRVIVSGPTVYPDEARRDPRQSDIDDVLRTFGLRVDMSDCATITVDGVRPQILRPFQSSLPEPPRAAGPARFKAYLATCHVVVDTRDNAKEFAERRAADRVFDRLESACPEVFQPRHSQSIHEAGTWMRRYPPTDVIAWLSDGELKFVDVAHGAEASVLGTEKDWTAAPQPLQCGRHHETYFANVLPAK
jgi:hypothetical protein